jgi:NTP pyrophosphatase (non-canonical NTP hydrolase)
MKPNYEMQRAQINELLENHEMSDQVRANMERLLKTNDDILAERMKQEAKWGTQRHNWGDWLIILVEEVGELSQAMGATKSWAKPTDAQNLYEEAIQVAAVAQAIAEHIRDERGF